MSAPEYAGDEAVVGGSAPELRAVLFDMDGTVTDSEKLWTIALERVAKGFGRRLSPEARDAMVGQDQWTTVDMLHTEFGVDADPAETAAKLTDATKELFALGIPFKPGAPELIAAVRADGLQAALVTATYRELVDIALDTIGHQNFDATVCGDEVHNNKPDPEPYLRALELLDLPASACLVIEDSPAGSRSAALAGIPVLVVPSEVPVAPAPGLAFAETLTDVGVAELRRVHAELSVAAFFTAGSQLR